MTDRQRTVCKRVGGQVKPVRPVLQQRSMLVEGAVGHHPVPALRRHHQRGPQLGEEKDARSTQGMSEFWGWWQSAANSALLLNASNSGKHQTAGKRGRLGARQPARTSGCTVLLLGEKKLCWEKRRKSSHTAQSRLQLASNPSS